MKGRRLSEASSQGAVRRRKLAAAAKIQNVQEEEPVPVQAPEDGAPRSDSRVDRRALSLGFDLGRREQSFSFRMREIIKLFSGGLAPDLRKFGVTMGQWQFLRALWEADGRSQRQLGNELNITSAATVFAVNMLERDGLATRQSDPTDSRRTLIFLTLKGHQLRAQLLPFARQIQLDAFEDFSDEEIAQLDMLLAKMKGNLQRSMSKLTAEAASGRKAKAG